MTTIRIRAARLAAAFLTLALFAACAGVSRQDMVRETKGFELPGEREPGKAAVYIVRPSHVGTLFRFNVFVEDPKADSLEAGFTRGGQYLHFNLGPGERVLYSVAENTANVVLDVHPDSTYFVRQDAKMGIVMARNKLVAVDAVEGKYHVKKTKPRTVKRGSFP